MLAGAYKKKDCNKRKVNYIFSRLQENLQEKQKKKNKKNKKKEAQKQKKLEYKIINYRSLYKDTFLKNIEGVKKWYKKKERTKK